MDLKIKARYFSRFGVLLALVMIIGIAASCDNIDDDDSSGSATAAIAGYWLVDSGEGGMELQSNGLVRIFSKKSDGSFILEAIGKYAAAGNQFIYTTIGRYSTSSTSTYTINGDKLTIISGENEQSYTRTRNPFDTLTILYNARSPLLGFWLSEDREAGMEVTNSGLIWLYEKKYDEDEYVLANVVMSHKIEGSILTFFGFDGESDQTQMFTFNLQGDTLNMTLINIGEEATFTKVSRSPFEVAPTPVPSPSAHSTYDPNATPAPSTPRRTDFW